MSGVRLEVRGIRKSFRRPAGWRDLFREVPRIAALRGIDFTVEPGEIFGLLGPNGAGKTTMVKIISGLVVPDEGEVLVGGVDRARDERRSRLDIGVVYGDERTFNWRLTVVENLRFYARLYRMPADVADARIAELLELVGLSDAVDRRMMAFSSGMRQRAAVARGLLHDPKVVLLDEPTRMLDPVGSHDLHALIRDRIAAQGRTVLLATNIMSEAEALCDRLMLMLGGVARMEGTVPDIRSRYRTGSLYRFVITGPTSGSQLTELTSIPGVTSVEVQSIGAGAWSLAALLGDDSALPQVIRHLLDDEFDIVSVAHDEPSLDEIFRSVVTEGRVHAA